MTDCHFLRLRQSGAAYLHLWYLLLSHSMQRKNDSEKNALDMANWANIMQYAIERLREYLLRVIGDYLHDRRGPIDTCGGGSQSSVNCLLKLNWFVVIVMTEQMSGRHL